MFLKSVVTPRADRRESPTLCTAFDIQATSENLHNAAGRHNGVFGGRLQNLKLAFLRKFTEDPKMNKLLRQRVLPVLTALFLLLALFPALSPATAAGVAYTPTGTMTKLAADPSLGVTGTYWSIEDGTELKALAAYVNNGSNTAGVTFYLTADIDISPASSGDSWVPIGGRADSIAASSMTYFAGYFDGSDGTDYYAISGLNINAAPAAATLRGWGLFGASSGTIANVTLSGSVTLTGSVAPEYVGGIVGYSKGIIWNCHNNASVFVTHTDSSMIGGIAGAIEGDGIYVRYSSNTGQVVGGSRVGGIAGAAYCVTEHGVIVDNCYNTGNLTTVSGTTKAYLGGIVGYCEGYISNAYTYDARLQTRGEGEDYGHYLAGVVGILNGYGPQAAMSNAYALSFFDSSTDPMYDKWLFASADRSGSTPLSNSLWVDTANWTGPPKSEVYINQPQPATGDPWGLWTNVGRFGSPGTQPDYDSKTDAYIFSDGAGWGSVSSALDILNTDSLGVAFGDQYKQDAAHNDGYPFLKWEDGSFPVPAAPVAPIIPPKAELNGVFLNGVSGDDGNNGLSKATPVKTFAQARTILEAPGTLLRNIYVTDTVTVSGNDTWVLGNPNVDRVIRSYDLPAAKPMVIVESGTLTLGDDPLRGITFGDNVADIPLESLFRVDAGGTLTVGESAGISGAVAQKGGAITVNGGVLNVKNDSLIAGNQAVDGGAIYVAGGTVNITGGVIRDNAVNTARMGAQTVRGGAIYVAGGTVNITGGTISGNSAETSHNSGNNAYGGAIYAAGGTVAISDGTISGNKAEVGGAGAGAVEAGGIYAATGATVTVTGGTLTGNAVLIANAAQLGADAVVSGGTLAFISPASGTTLNWTGDIKLAAASDNVKIGAALTGMTGTLNISTGYAAAANAVVAVGTTGYPALAAADINKLNYIGDPNYYIDLSAAGSAILALGGVYVSYNTAGGGDGSSGDPFGKLTDALAAVAGTHKPIVITDTTYVLAASELDLAGGVNAGARIRRNTGYTGALFSVASGVSVAVSGVTVDGNGTSVPSATGSLFSVAGTLTLGEGAVLQNNVATLGGGVNVASGGSLVLNGGVITGNTVGTSATSNQGGGVYLSGGSLTLSSGSIAGNRANAGGGVYATGSRLTLSGGTVGGNYAYGLGGGITFASPPSSSSAPNLLISGTAQITNNTSVGDSGGVYISGNNVNASMTGGKISGNNGKGVYIASASSAVFNMSGGEISNNLSGGSGAGINVNSYGTFTLSDSAKISGNISKVDGGGVHFTGDGLNLNGGEISDNTAQGEGGGLYSAGTASLNGTDIIGNTAVGYGNAYSGNGGGVFVNAGTFTLTTGTIADNIAGGSGGGLYQGGGTVNAGGGEISGNSAQNGGGLYYAAINAMNLAGTAVSGNEATANGGGLYVNYGYDDSVIMTAGALRGNTAGGNGGGVYIESGRYFNLNGGEISGNAAALGQGIYAAWITSAGTTYPLIVEPETDAQINAPDIIYLGGTTGANTARIDLNVRLSVGTSGNMATPFSIQVGTPGRTRVVAVATDQTMAQNSVAAFTTWQGIVMAASGSNINYNATALTDEDSSE
jgi:hypothetical protein